MSMIELDNVSKKIKKVTVIDHVSLNLEGGRIYGLKGINGSGKTMLMRLICGLIRPTEGCIKIQGKILGKEISFPESIGLLLENPAFLDTYSGIDNLKLLASIRRVTTEQQLENSMLRVGLSPFDTKRYKKYSLGMKQRLGIAAAVMESPDIIILDEPTNSLDSDGVEMVQELLKKEKKRGALIILACHDFETLKMLSDQIYHVRNGAVSDE